MKDNIFVQVLKNSNFRKLWGSQLFSQVTINMINFLIILRIFEASHSTVAVSLVWVFYAIPAILLGPFSGTISDLVEKRKIMIWTNFLEAAIVLLYIFAQQKIWTIYSIIFLYSLVNQLYIPAESSTLPKIVPKKLYPPANSIFIFTVYGSFLAGYTLAGPLVRLVGNEIPFFLGALLLVIAGISVSLLPRGLQGCEEKVHDIQDFWDRVKEGYSFIHTNKIILFPLVLIVIAQIIIGVLAVLVPMYASEILSVDLRDAALVLVTPTGLGALLGSQLVVTLLRRGVRKKRVITSGLFLASISLFLYGVLIPILPLGRTVFAVLSAFMMGLSFVALIIPSQTLIQEFTPQKLLGRVYGVLGFMITIAAILPMLMVATVADLIGVGFVVGLIALATLGIGFYSLGEPYGNHD